MKYLRVADVNPFGINVVTLKKKAHASARMRLTSLFGGVIGEHLVSEGPVVCLVIELERNHHAFLTVLALKLLANHEPHVGIDTNAVACNADSKRHGATPRSLFFAEGRSEFFEVDAVVLVGVQRHDDVRDVSGREHIAQHVLDPEVELRSVDGPVAVGVKGSKHVVDRHALLAQRLS